MMDGVPIIDPAKVPGVLYFVPIGKSPHGMDVDPSGKWIVAGGKLQPATTVLNFEKVQAAINNKTFEGDFRGIPILKYEAVVEGEVPVGLGPLHTQYDGKGNAYTSMFIDSNIMKWKLPPWTDEERKDLNKAVLDKVPAHFSTGHLVVAGSDTAHPYGKWCVAMNKLSAGRHINVGPSQPESSQLIDISGEKMKMVAEAYTEPEPHFAQILKVSDIQPTEVYPKDENKDPNAVWEKAQTGVTRTGNQVVAKLIAIRSRFNPDRIDAQVGDELTVHVTNVEQTRDMIHGFGLIEHNINMVMDPGETKTFHIKLTKPGVFPFYCTNFCSALHQEMQGYLVVREPGEDRPVRLQAAGRSAAKNYAALQRGSATGRGGKLTLQIRRISKASQMTRKVSGLLRREFRFLHKPLNLWSRLLLARGRGDDWGLALFSAVENAPGRAAIFRRARSIYFSLQDPGRRIERPAPERDQQSQSLHRHEADPAGRLHGDALDAVRFRSHHFDDAALGCIRRDEQRGRSVRRLHVLRLVLHRLVLVSALQIRT